MRFVLFVSDKSELVNICIVERISFEAYNESTCLMEAVERFKERTGYYPEYDMSWQIRFIGPEKTGVIAKSMGSGCRVQGWADQVLRQKVIKNKSIRIIPIESKWSVSSV